MSHAQKEDRHRGYFFLRISHRKDIKKEVETLKQFQDILIVKAGACQWNNKVL